MEGSVVASAAVWYGALALFGLAGLLPCAVLFERLASRGVGFARPLGLALAALITWLAVHLTPLAYGTAVILVVLAALLVLSAGLALWRREVLRAVVARWRTLAILEVVTLVAFVLVLWVRVVVPGAWGTEKPADLMLLNAVHRAEEFPPPDPWLSGEHLSYYHLGHLQMDLVTRLSGERPDTAFNLATATAGALATAAVAGLAADVVRLAGPRRRREVLLAGGAGVAGLLLVSPLVGPVQIAAANGLGGEAAYGWLGVEDVPTNRPAVTLVPDEFWWWWPTTRVIPDVISEYPGFSLVLGDPHAHLLALPLGLAALALAVQVFEGSTPLGWRRWLTRPELLLLTAAVFAALAMTNSWDVVTYGAIWAIAAWWSAARTGWPVPLAGFIAARWALIPALVGFAMAWPFLETLEPQPLGVAPVIGEYSDPVRWLLVWFPLLVPAAIGIACLWRPPQRRLFDALTYSLVALGLWVMWLAWREDTSEVLDRGVGWITIVGLLAGLGWTVATLASEPLARRAHAAGLFLVASALGVLSLTELVHINDAFPGRLNTAFKFWFHAWALLAVGGAALLALAIDPVIATLRRNLERLRSVPAARALPRPRVVLGGVGLAMTALTMLTPPMAAVARAREGHEHGLSALAYLARTDPGFVSAIQWGRRELDPREDVIAEAISESYDEGSRFSAFTGVPTILGWPGHERQWRSDISEGARRTAIETIYTGTRREAEAAVREWRVTYVLVGHQERMEYGVLVSTRFAGWPVVFSTPTTQVFQTPYRSTSRLSALGVELVTAEPR